MIIGLLSWFCLLYTSYVNSTKEANDAAILKERLLELAFEGKRWWDLVRFDKAFDLVPSCLLYTSRCV